MGVPELKEMIRLRIENADEHTLRIVANLLNEEKTNKENESDISDEETNLIRNLLKKSEKEYEAGETELFRDVLNEVKRKYLK